MTVTQKIFKQHNKQLEDAGSVYHQLSHIHLIT